MSNKPSADSGAAPAGPPGGLSEVRYSLPAMLQELEAERASGVFAMEKLDQLEIGKLFKTKNAARRAKSRK